MTSSAAQALHQELLSIARQKTAGIGQLVLDAIANNPTAALGTAALGGAALGAIPAWLIKSHQAEQERLKTRNRAFGAGMAAGVATPRILRGLVGAAQDRGLLGS